MNVDYGSRIRAVADYLESSVPGEKYNFGWPSLKDGCGCVVAHGMAAGIIPESYGYFGSVKWLMGVAGGFVEAFRATDFTGKGELAKQAAIKQLRAYADANYPVSNSTRKHEGIPDSVLALFTDGVAA